MEDFPKVWREKCSLEKRLRDVLIDLMHMHRPCMLSLLFRLYDKTEGLDSRFIADYMKKSKGLLRYNVAKGLRAYRKWRLIEIKKSKFFITEEGKKFYDIFSNAELERVIERNIRETYLPQNQQPLSTPNSQPLNMPCLFFDFYENPTMGYWDCSFLYSTYKLCSGNV